LFVIAEGQTAIGAQQFFQMLVVALVIAAVLLVGNTIARSEVTL
jgi:hypothetical protein